MFMHTAASMTTSLSSPNTMTDGSELLARLFAGVSDPTRLRILLALLEREHNVSELVALVGTAQSRVSTHLQCLRWCRFVSSERRGKYVYYKVSDPRVRQLIQLAQDLVVQHGAQLAACAVLRAEDQDKESHNESL